ncbi:MAG: hypothetical protein WAQ08_15950 [Aquabacterium sp.]|uniref:hypothetical protein n=1 Tax=Aquabacterium sp. TaxID=1872578 RepID=UPI003BAF0A1A
MSRTFGALNKTDPVWLTPMATQVPACYTPEAWANYLQSVRDEAQDDEVLRARLRRGQVPDYCADCTRGHQRRMVAAGKCAPPVENTPPMLPIEVAA